MKGKFIPSVRYVNLANKLRPWNILALHHGLCFLFPRKFMIPNSYRNMLILRAHCYTRRWVIFFENCRSRKVRNRDSIFTLKGTPILRFFFLSFTFFLSLRFLFPSFYPRSSSICTFSIFNRVGISCCLIIISYFAHYFLPSFLFTRFIKWRLTIPTAIFHTCAMDYDLLNWKIATGMGKAAESLFIRYYEIIVTNYPVKKQLNNSCL